MTGFPKLVLVMELQEVAGGDMIGYRIVFSIPHWILLHLLWEITASVLTVSLKLSLSLF